LRQFLIKYLLSLALFFILIDFQIIRDIVDFQKIHTDSTIFFSTILMKLVGISVMGVEGIDIILENARLRVLFGCNGLEAILLYFAGVIAFRDSDIINKLNWFFWGYLTLFFINIVRITFLAYIVENAQDYFELMHTYITQSIMIFIALMIFIQYVKNLKNANS